MRVEVMQHYRLTQPLSQAGYYETSHHQQLIKDIKSAVLEGRLIALCGVIGSGKTVMLRRLQQQLKAENRVLVSKSLAVEKHSIKLGTHVQGVRINHAIFASEAVLFLDWECRIHKSVLWKTEMLQPSCSQCPAESLVTIHFCHVLPQSSSKWYPHP